MELMRFENRTLNKDFINQAIMKAEFLLSDESPMMNELLLKNDFKYGSGTGYQVCKKISECNKIAPVFFYKPRNPWTKALGYSDGKAIHLNSRKFNTFTLHDLTGLLVHEWFHFGPGFNHGNNWPSDEKNNFSVNYFCSSNISKGKWL